MTTTPAYEDILYEKRDNRAAWIIINRPKLYNAFRAQTMSCNCSVCAEIAKYKVCGGGNDAKTQRR